MLIETWQRSKMNDFFSEMLDFFKKDELFPKATSIINNYILAKLAQLNLKQTKKLNWLKNKKKVWGFFFEGMSSKNVGWLSWLFICRDISLKLWETY